MRLRQKNIDHSINKIIYLYTVYFLFVFAAILNSFQIDAPQTPIAVAFIVSCLPLGILFHMKSGKSSFFSNRYLSVILACGCSSLFLAAGFILIYQSLVLRIANPINLLSPDNLVRIYLLFWPMCLVIAYVIYEEAKVTDFLFRYRWYIALFVILILTIAKINFSNISYFSFIIQPELNTEFTYPLFGTPRGIRSDEWLVTTPRKISAEYSNYGKYNYIARATENYNIGCADLYFSYSAFSYILHIGYYLFGSEYGASFFWSSLFVLSFMTAFEFSYILSNKKRLIALLGASMIGLSQFTLWWSINCHIPAMMAIIICATYFFETQNKVHRTAYAFGVALAGNVFICNLYPAWQVPMAYVLLALLIWVFVTHFDSLKQLKAFDWCIIACAFIFMCSVVIAYLYNSREYNAQVMSTVYPGARIDTGGGTLDKLMQYVATLLFPFKDTGNNSEAGTFFNLFPLPMVFTAGYLLIDIYSSIKNKKVKIDLFNLFLFVPTVFILFFCTTGFPIWLAKCTLMSYSTSSRSLDVLGLINAFFLVRIIGQDHKKIELPIWLTGIFIFFSLSYALTKTSLLHPDYMKPWYIAFISLFILAFGIAVFCRMHEKQKKPIIASVIIVLLICGLSVLPVTRGLESVLHKPASYAIQQIVKDDPDGKWISPSGIEPPQFLIANGAPTINSTNYVPNMELWSKLDPSGIYNEVYNRYSHVYCHFTEEKTSFELLTPDCIRLHLSYSDFATADIRYVFSLSSLEEESDFVDFQLLYNEGNVFIYEVLYPQ